MPLDPEDPRPPYQQIAGAIRAAIKTRKFEPGDKIPSQNELAASYGVSRMTVNQSLRVLRDEGLLLTRPGSGVYVRVPVERQIHLGAHLESAFARQHVSVDFSGLSGESLQNALADVLAKVRVGRYTPESIQVRALVVDTSQPLVLPCLAETAEDDPRVRHRSDEISRRSAGSLIHLVHELEELGFVGSAAVEVRVHRIAPAFKLYLLNDEEALFAFYPVSEHEITIDGGRVGTYDVLGLDSMYFHHALSDGPDTPGAQFVGQARKWFASVWTSIAKEYQP